MNPKEITQQLTDFLRKHQNISDAPAMKAYMRNQFEFLGLKKDLREATCKAFWQDRPAPALGEIQGLVLELWESPYRELQYHALELMIKNAKKMDGTWLPFLEGLILKKSWWDTVDVLAPKLIGGILLKEPNLVVPYSEKWIDSDNFWLQRTAILFQLKYKTKTNQKRLFDYILSRANSKEFFVQKASGWALREYAKTNPNAVLFFAEIHKDILSPLTYKEAVRVMKKNA